MKYCQSGFLGVRMDNTADFSTSFDGDVLEAVDQIVEKYVEEKREKTPQKGRVTIQGLLEKPVLESTPVDMGRNPTILNKTCKEKQNLFTLLSDSESENPILEQGNPRLSQFKRKSRSNDYDSQRKGHKSKVGCHKVRIHYADAVHKKRNDPSQTAQSQDESQGFDGSRLQYSFIRPPSQKKTDLSAWNLPESVLSKYKEKGITSMFEWQAECLSQDSVLEGGNLVYSAPTSAGKTMVAELLMLKRVLDTRKRAIMILPFVSVATEKMAYLQSLFMDAGLQIDGFMGNHSPAGGLKNVHIAICTIEKANSLINKLIEENSLHLLGCLVIDELHMIGDTHRGYLLELLLTKVLYVSSRRCEDQEKRPSVQIVGMSATLPNLDALARWLQAEVYRSDYRPVPLTECIKVGTALYDSQLHKIRDLDLPRTFEGDEDHVISLCLETITSGHSILIFCPSKVWCEKLAESIAREFYKMNTEALHAARDGPEQIDTLARHFLLDRIQDVYEQLRRTPVGLDDMLKRIVPYGVAFHHAGLTFDERDIVENGFRQGAIRVLVATSTLSSGVNLPARRVIVRTPMFYGRLLDILTYKQMVGRAGRMGVDTEGESILLCKPSEKSNAVTLIGSELCPVTSCLLKDGAIGSSLKRAVLEVVVSGAAQNRRDVECYAECTLLASSLPQAAVRRQAVEACVSFMEENELIVCVEDGGESRFRASQLGSAILASALSPDEGLTVFRELQRARQSFVLDTELHLIYEVTPVYVSDVWSGLDWCQYLFQFEALPPSMRRVAELVGVEERFLSRAVSGRVLKTTEQQRRKLAVHLRFYTALVLHDLAQEVPMMEVACKYKCNRGQLQALQQSAATFAGMVTVFCNRLGWYNMELLMSQFQARLTFGVQRELCDLVRVSLLNGLRARHLYNAGITTLAALGTADAHVVEAILRKALPFESKKAQEGESDRELNQRVHRHCIHRTGQEGLTESQAAEMIIQEAREILERELGLAPGQLSSGTNPGNMTSTSLSSTTTVTDVTTFTPVTSKMAESNVTATLLVTTSKESYPDITNLSVSGRADVSSAVTMTAGTAESSEASSALSGNLVNSETETGSFYKPDLAGPGQTSVIFSSKNDKYTTNCEKKSENADGVEPDSRLKRVPADPDLSLTPPCITQLPCPTNMADKSDVMRVDMAEKNDDSDFDDSLVLDTQIENMIGRLETNKISPKLPRSVISGSGTNEITPFKLHSVIRETVSASCIDKSVITEKSQCGGINQMGQNLISMDSAEPVKLIPDEMPTSEDTDSHTVIEDDINQFIQNFIDDGRNETRLCDQVDNNSVMRSSCTEDNSLLKDSEDMFADDVPSDSENLSLCLSGGDSPTAVEKLKTKPVEYEVSEPAISDLTLQGMLLPDFVDESSRSARRETRNYSKFEQDLAAAELLCDSTTFSPSGDVTSATDDVNNLSPSTAAILDLVTSPTKRRPAPKAARRQLDSSPSLLKKRGNVDKVNNSQIDNKFIKKTATTNERMQKQTCDIFLKPSLVRKKNETFLVGRTKISLSEDDDVNTVSDVNTSQSEMDEFNDALNSFDDVINTSDDVIPATPLSSSVTSSIRSRRQLSRTIETRSSLRVDDDFRGFDGSCLGKGFSLERISVANQDWFFAEWLEQRVFSLAVACEPAPPSRRKAAAGSLDLVCDGLLVTGLAVTWSDKRVFYLTVDHNNLPLIRSILESDDVKIGVYDAKRHYKLLCRACALVLGPCRDPAVSYWLLDSGRKETNLHGLLAEFLPLLVDGMKGVCRQRCCQPCLHLAPSVRACVEASLVVRLQNLLEKKLAERNLMEAFVQTEMPALLTIAKMELNGIGFSEGECCDQLLILQSRLREIEQQCFHLAGHPFNISSSKDIQQVLFVELRLPPTGEEDLIVAPSRTSRATARGRCKRYSTKQNILAKLKDRHKLPALILEWRKISSTIKQIIHPLMKASVRCDELDMYRIDFLAQYHTATGRVIVAEPPLQMIPKTYTISRDQTICIRRTIVPSQGCVLLTADYSQLELRLLAHLSRDRKLMTVLNSGGDVFRQLSAVWWRKRTDDITDTERQQAKQICYGMVYGVGVRAMAEQLEITEQTAEKYMDSFKNTYSGIRTFQHEMVKQCRRHGYVTTLFGRRRYLSAINSTNPHQRAHAERQAVNTSVQGSAADLVKKAQINIEKSLARLFPENKYTHKHPGFDTRCRRGGQFVLQVHDELVYEVTWPDLNKVADVIKQEMENSVQLPVKFPVKIKVGQSWGEMEEYEL